MFRRPAGKRTEVDWPRVGGSLGCFRDSPPGEGTRSPTSRLSDSGRNHSESALRRKTPAPFCVLQQRCNSAWTPGQGDYRPHCVFRSEGSFAPSHRQHDVDHGPRSRTGEIVRDSSISCVGRSKFRSCTNATIASIHAMQWAMPWVHAKTQSARGASPGGVCRSDRSLTIPAESVSSPCDHLAPHLVCGSLDRASGLLGVSKGG